MASIIKRKKSYSVVYSYEDSNGETKQKWETCHTLKDAQKRKAEIEYQQSTGTFLPPSRQSVKEFLADFVSTYGEKKWGVSMYDSQTSLIDNYINPIIGDMEIQSITTRVVDKYIQTLQKTPAVATKSRRARTEFVTDKTIGKIIKLLRCAFNQAVRWELIAKNPFTNSILPKTEYAKRDIWDADTIRKALEECRDSKLYIAMNLAFACSLRMGEILGLTWDCVDFDTGEIKVCKQLQKRPAADGGFVFAPLKNDKTRVIKPAPFVMELLKIRRAEQAQQCIAAGKLWTAWNSAAERKTACVFTSALGDHLHPQTLYNHYKKITARIGLTDSRVHDLRHTFAVLSLQNGDDIKTVQGNLGHATAAFTLDVYGHVSERMKDESAARMEKYIKAL